MKECNGINGTNSAGSGSGSSSGAGSTPSASVAGSTATSAPHSGDQRVAVGMGLMGLAMLVVAIGV